MRKTIFKELVVYLIMFFVLAAAMHPDLLSAPWDRVSLMGERENYMHPFVYTLLAYLLVYIVRLLFRAVFSVLMIYKKR
jgi:hypothetical protein